MSYYREPWSMPKNVAQIFESQNHAHVYEIASYPEDDQAPSVAMYEPVTLGELSIDPSDHSESLSRAERFPDADFSEAPWKYLEENIVHWVDLVIETWEEDANDDWEHPGIVTSEENSEHLEKLHETVLQLTSFQDVREYFAWLSEATDRLDALRVQQNKPMQKLRLSAVRDDLKTKIDDLEKEIEEFEEEWGFRERVAAYEELLLNTYVARVVAAQKRVLERRSTHSGVGKFGPKPSPRAIKSSYDFEHYCHSWMIYLGAEDAEVSRATGDGGVDIISESYVAQVKLFNGPIPVSQVRDLLGTAVDFGRKPLFFASMSYSKGSLEFADRNGIALFTVDSFRGEITAANHAAMESITHGLHG